MNESEQASDIKFDNISKQLDEMMKDEPKDFAIVDMQSEKELHQSQIIEAKPVEVKDVEMVEEIKQQQVPELSQEE